MACGWSPVGLYFDVILKSIFFLISSQKFCFKVQNYKKNAINRYKD
ncbi:Uncharacterised protein [Segatella copri]|jgi:hypothetical protein|nr:Uncharacterised protein [Segatella copri]